MFSRIIGKIRNVFSSQNAPTNKRESFANNVIRTLPVAPTPPIAMTAPATGSTLGKRRRRLKTEANRKNMRKRMRRVRRASGQNLRTGKKA